VELGVDEAWLDDLVERLQQEVQVYEVDGVAWGRVPASMVGWWISTELAARLETHDDGGADAAHALLDDDTGES
jgi:hypothetical protein